MSSFHIYTIIIKKFWYFQIIKYIDNFCLNFWFLVSIRQAICSKFWLYSKIGHGKVLKESQFKSVSNFNLIVSFNQKNIISYYWLMGVKFSSIYHNYQKILIFSDNQIYWQFFLNFRFLVSLRQALYLKFLIYSKIRQGKVLKETQNKNVYKYNFIALFIQRNIILYCWFIGVKFSPLCHNHIELLIFSDCQIYWHFYEKIVFLV